MRSRLTGTALALVVLLVATGAQAAPTEPQQETEEAGADATESAREFSRAVALFKSGEIERALPLFSSVAESTQSPNAWLYVGNCLTWLGQHAEAHAAYSKALEEIDRRGEARYDATREAAAAQLSWLTVRVAKLVLSLSDEPNGMATKVDGRLIDREVLGSPIVLAPGVHRIEATGENVEPVLREIEIKPGETKTITIAFQKRPAIEQGAQPVPAPTDTRDRAATAVPTRGSNSTLRALGFASAGVSAAGFAIFAAAGLKAQSTYEDLRRECPNGDCANADQRDRIERGKTEQTFANAGLVIGAVGAVAGGVLLYFGYADSGERPLGLTLSTKHASVEYRTRF